MATMPIDAMKFTRITVKSNQMGGVPCTRRLRIPVATVVGMVADGVSESEILDAYPDRYAARTRTAAGRSVRFLVDDALSPVVLRGAGFSDAP